MKTLDQERAITLLKAAHYLLYRCSDSHFVLSATRDVAIPYDDTECDGYCLMEDIQYLLEEVGINAMDFV